MARSEGDWYGVRCIFRWDKWDGAPFEERITLWQAESADAAIELAEAEAEEYATEHGLTYLGLAQCYSMEPEEPGHAVEVFSLLRDSDLPNGEYLSTFFDTGREHSTEAPADDEGDGD
jgi:hypothetical protein